MVDFTQSIAYINFNVRGKRMRDGGREWEQEKKCEESIETSK